MKKETSSKTVKKENMAKVIEHLLDMWGACNDEMDKHELKSYVNSDNSPNMKRLNDSDEIGVDEVLLIGGYLALNRLHHIAHKRTHKELERQIEGMLGGDVTVRAVVSEDMPEELKELIENLVETVKKRKKKGDK